MVGTQYGYCLKCLMLFVHIIFQRHIVNLHVMFKECSYLLVSGNFLLEPNCWNIHQGCKMLKSCDVGNDHHSMSRYPHEQTYLISDSYIVYSRNQYNYFSTCTLNSYISYHLLHMIHPGLDDYPNLLFSFNKKQWNIWNLNVWKSWRLKHSHRRCPGPSWTSSQVKQSGNIFLRNIVLPGGFWKIGGPCVWWAPASYKTAPK